MGFPGLVLMLERLAEGKAVEFEVLSAGSLADQTRSNSDLFNR